MCAGRRRRIQLEQEMHGKVITFVCPSLELQPKYHHLFSCARVSMLTYEKTHDTQKRFIYILILYFLSPSYL